jgi:NDP-sugar pyrophosphorylase family protein
MKQAHPPTRAIILAAGRGHRLRPYTDNTPKPLLPVNGRPTLDYILQALAMAAVTDVCLVTQHLAGQIEAYVGDGHKWAMCAGYRRQPAMLGTAHALKMAADFITAPCFVLAADYALPLTYLQDLKAAYRQSNATLAVSLKQLPLTEINNRSSVRFAADGRILEIVEKPAPGTAPSAIGASLLYIVPPVICRYLVDMPLSERQEYELPAVINQMLSDGYEMVGCLQPAPPEWQKP